MSSNKQLYRYGHELNTHDLLKILAITLMIIDHVGLYLLNDNMICRLLGRGAAPIFFFLVGYSGKVNVKLSLIVYGIILSITGGLLGHQLWINILLCFIFIDFSLRHFKLETLSLLTRIIGFAALVAFNYFIYPYVEYGTIGLMIAYSARSVALKEPYARLWMGLSLTVLGIYQALTFRFIQHEYILIFFGAMMITLFFLFQGYRLIVIPWRSKMTWLGLVIARYSLDIYFYQVIILQAYYVFERPYFIERYFN